MERQIATTKEQSARLLQCGVPAESADMSWNKAKAANRDGYAWLLLSENFLKSDNSDRCVPAWSLSALLELMPKEMGIAVGAYPGSNKYACFTLIDPDVEPIVADTAVEAVVQMVEQLKNNGYKLNEQ